MLIAALISGVITLLIFILSLVFRISGKLRLTVPVIYFLLLCTIFNGWAGSHETLAFAILYCLLAVVVISWIISLIRLVHSKRQLKTRKDDVMWQIAKAREKGISTDCYYIDSHGNMRYKDTNESVF